MATLCSRLEEAESCEEVLQIIEEAGKDEINQQNEAGWTPLRLVIQIYEEKWAAEGPRPAISRAEVCALRTCVRVCGCGCVYVCVVENVLRGLNEPKLQRRAWLRRTATKSKGQGG